MYLLPLARMLQRVEAAKEDSDTSYLLALMYLGELVTKFTVAALVAAIMNDKDRHRYRELHRLVRADGIGDWADALGGVLTGPASQFLQRQARVEQRELTQRFASGWQYQAVSQLDNCMKLLDGTREHLPSKVDGRRWFSIFAELRNKTRGHGAPSAQLCSKLAPLISSSIDIVIANHSLFRRPWVYLHRNLSGKYRVTTLTDTVNAEEFERLKSDRSTSLPNGVYTYFDRPTLVELLVSDPERNDFFLPNGGFNGKRFEYLSYITGHTVEAEAAPYLIPATELPPSETEGVGLLDVQGMSFGNLPPIPAGYVERKDLENILKARIIDERYPVITLAGRGGIGKTSAALATLHAVAGEGRFGALLWFSARDIDLLQEGPKVVRPQIHTESDIANEFVRLTSPADALKEGFDPLGYLAGALSKGLFEAPTLFVVDNFETVRSPAEVFTWLDTYIRPPNKLLITTRFRDFKGDYPVDVLGMTDRESLTLVNSMAHSLQISTILTGAYKEEVIRVAEGHPYVMKILLGEVAKVGVLIAVKRVIAAKDDILPALFERTFEGLSPAARRVFLLLSAWRSTVPELAIHAVLTRPSAELMDVGDAIDELVRSSLIDVAVSSDTSRFVSVPFVASEFGKRKLAVSASKSSIQADLELLQMFGPGQKTDLVHGLAPRIGRLFKHIADLVTHAPESLDHYLPIAEFVSRQYLPGWLQVATLYEQSQLLDKLERAKDAVRRYLERAPTEEQRLAWDRLAELCSRTDDWMGELHARVALCELPDTPFETISDTANRLNGLYARQQFLDSEERRILVGRLAALMESRLAEAEADDISRLAWLQLHLHNEERARQLTEDGLALDASNEHCLNLRTRLGR